MHRHLAILAALIVSVVGCLQARSDAPARTEAHRLVEILELEPGDAVAEVGAGNGELTADVARVLGPRSRVFTTELKSELATLRERVADEPNVTVIEAVADSTNLPESCCEAIYLKRVFHHFRRPERNAASLYRSVRPGGRVAVIDFEPKAHWDEPEGAPERGGHGMPSKDLVSQMRAAGFELVRVEQEWSGDLYVALFRRP